MKRARGSASIDLVLLFAGLAILFVVTPFAIEGDGRIRFEALSDLLSRGEVSHAPYSMIGPLASAPLWLIDRLQGAGEWWSARFNFFLFTAGLVGFYGVMTPHVDRRVVVRFLLLLTAASMFPHHNGRYYSEVFTAVLVGLGLSLVSLRGTWWGWLLVIVGVANTPASIAGLAIVSAVWTVRQRDARYLLPLLFGAALVMGELWFRRGSPFATGYEGNRGAQTVLPYSGRPGFSYPFLLGLLSILFSFGKGLAFFAPGLLLSKRPLQSATGGIRDMAILWLCFLAGLVLIYSKWWGWYGGDFWGPRFFLFASIPAAFAIAAWSCAPARSIGSELVGMACLAWSLWVGVNGLVFGLYSLEICSANHYALEFLCWYVPEFSALFRPFITPKPLAGFEYGVLAYFLLAGVYIMMPRAIDVAGRLRATFMEGSASPRLDGSV